MQLCFPKWGHVPLQWLMLRNLHSSGAFVRVLEKTTTKKPRCEVGERHFPYITLHLGSDRMPFAFTIAIILHGIHPTGCFKHSSKILVNAGVTGSQRCCRFVSCTPMMRISCSTTVKDTLFNSDLVPVEFIWVQWPCCHAQETSLRWLELCPASCTALLSLCSGRSQQ